MGEEIVLGHRVGQCFLNLESPQWVVTAEPQKGRLPSLPRWADMNAAQDSGCTATPCTEEERGHGLLV